MKQFSFIRLSICFVFALLTFGSVHGQVQDVGLDLISVEQPGWFNQIRFKNGELGGIRHVITDHGDRDRLVIHPGFGAGANKEVEISGKVAIGTTQMPSSVGVKDVSSYRLFVRGGILTEEILVRSGWADYVFDESYFLMPISELDNFIQKNKHLPNIPSAMEVETNGLELKDITVKQQEKIEEAFLYIIQLEKKINSLKEKIQNLEKE